MRTTLTLDDDVWSKLRAEMQRTNKGLKQTVNDVLRIGLHATRDAPSRERFVVEARDLGDTLQGVGLDNVGELLDRLDQPPGR